jgi:hypothetical protein
MTDIPKGREREVILFVIEELRRVSKDMRLPAEVRLRAAKMIMERAFPELKKYD